LISLIVPAYNEEGLIGRTLDALRDAALALGEPHEVVVVDDASTDRTAEIAASRGARVVPVSRRQIAAVRNAGARVATGEILFFIDADTVVPPGTLRAAVAAVRGGAAGGGARVQFDRVPASMWLFTRGFAFFYHLVGLAAGCFIFARRDAFDAAGGFDERYFASEEVHLSRALRRRGRFVILRERVTTSGRKCRMYSPGRLCALLLRILLRGPRGLRRREGLGLWYDGRREPPDVSAAGQSSPRT
jgi:glycosyltransferase involved in cell wall biosynthesis